MMLGNLRDDENIELKTYVLDSSKIKIVLKKATDKLMEHIEELNDSTLIDYKTINMLHKVILTRAICKLMSDSNDQPIHSLLPFNYFEEDIMSGDLRPYINDVNDAVSKLYVDTFRFNGNKEIYVEVMLTGISIIVHTTAVGIE